MAKTKISEFDIDPANNTDINSINIAEGCAPSGINNAIRQLMSDLKEFQTGAGGDSLTAVGLYSDTIGEKTSGAGVTVDGVLLKDNAVTASGGFSGALNGAVGGTTPAAGAFTTLSASSTLTVTGAGSIQGLTVGRGAGAVATNTAVGYNSIGATATGDTNTGLGYRALQAVTSGSSNTGLGAYTSGAITTGNYNASVGYGSLNSATTGSYNTALGASALASNTTATDNTAIGYQALYNNTASQNTTVGRRAGYSNTTGSVNAFGANALYNNTTGAANSAFGGYDGSLSGADGALFSNTTGNYNSAFGVGALKSNTTASNNTAVGAKAGFVNTATGNTFLGTNSGLSNTTGTGIIAVGYGALSSNTTGLSNIGIGGYDATNNIFGALANSTTGSYNVAVGVGALTSNTTASNNTAVGYQAGYSNTTGANNTVLGYQALYSNTTASYNTAVGINAGYSQSTGLYNTYLGRDSGYSATGSSSCFVGHTSGYYTTGSNNTLIGSQSGYLITSGAKNTVLGSFSGNQGGLDIRTASNYIVLSDGDGNPRGIFDGSGRFFVGTTSQIGAGLISAKGTYGVNYAIACSTTTTSSEYQIAFLNPNGTVGRIETSGSSTSYVTSSDYRLKDNIAPMTGALATVAQLKPVTYTWKIDGSDGQGFIAHELAEVCPDAVTGEKDAVNADGSIKPQGIDTSYLVATLTAAIQEQQAIIENLTTRLTALENK